MPSVLSLERWSLSASSLRYNPLPPTLVKFPCTISDDHPCQILIGPGELAGPTLFLCLSQLGLTTTKGHRLGLKNRNLFLRGLRAVQDQDTSRADIWRRHCSCLLTMSSHGLASVCAFQERESSPPLSSSCCKADVSDQDFNPIWLRLYLYDLI